MIECLFIAICIFLNAILSCIEMAFITVSKAHIKKLAESDYLSAKKVLLLKTNQERTLSVLQLGFTILGGISAAFSGVLAINIISPYLLRTWQISLLFGNLTAIALVIIPLTFFLIFFGELIPKSIALRFPLRIVLLGGYILFYLDLLFYPVVYLLETSNKFLTHFVFMNFKSENPISTAGNVDLANLTEAHKQYIFNLINVDKRTVKDVMLPWEQTTTIYINEHQHEVHEKIKASRHTRMPVINENDEVIGLLHAKEFVSESEIAKLDWSQLIRKIPELNSKEPILSALKKLQNQKCHLAIIKENDKIIGIVTMEDIFEEVVGEIYDEDDEPNTLLSVNSRLRTMSMKK